MVVFFQWKHWIEHWILHTQDVIVKDFVDLWTHKIHLLTKYKKIVLCKELPMWCFFFSGCCTFSEVFSIWTFDCFSIKRQNCQTVGPKCVSNRYIEDITWPRRDTKFLFECWKIFHKWDFVSPSGHVMFHLLYKHQWNTKPFHFNSFWCERRDLLCSHSKGDIFKCEDNMSFSHVKISSFRVKPHLVHWCLYNNVSYCPCPEKLSHVISKTPVYHIIDNKAVL